MKQLFTTCGRSVSLFITALTLNITVSLAQFSGISGVGTGINYTNYGTITTSLDAIRPYGTGTTSVTVYVDFWKSGFTGGVDLTSSTLYYKTNSSTFGTADDITWTPVTGTYSDVGTNDRATFTISGVTAGTDIMFYVKASTSAGGAYTGYAYVGQSVWSSTAPSSQSQTYKIRFNSSTTNNTKRIDGLDYDWQSNELINSDGGGRDLSVSWDANNFYILIKASGGIGANDRINIGFDTDPGTLYSSLVGAFSGATYTGYLTPEYVVQSTSNLNLNVYPRTGTGWGSSTDIYASGANLFRNGSLAEIVIPRTNISLTSTTAPFSIYFWLSNSSDEMYSGFGLDNYPNSYSASARRMRTALVYSNSGSGVTVNTGYSLDHNSSEVSRTLGFTSGIRNLYISANNTTTNATATTITGNVVIESLAGLILGNDLTLSGNWTRNSTGTFTPSNKAVFFNGSNNQSITVTGGGTESFAYLVIDKTTGSLMLNNSPSTSVDLTGTTGDVLQLNNTVGLDLNGQRLTITNTGTSIKLNSGNRSVTSTLSGGVFSITGGAGSVGITTPGTLTFGPNVTLGLSRGFNSGAAANVTVNGILQINANGYLDTNPVTYGPSSTLLYASGSYTVSNEWTTGGTVGAGVPFNVTLNLSGVTSAVQYITTSRTVPGNLTITQGELNADAALIVIGNVSMATNGLLDGSDVTVTVSGDWSANSTKSGNGYTGGTTGTLIFNGTGTRTFSHVGGASCKNLTFSGTGSYTISNDINAQTLTTISNGTIDFGTNRLYGSGNLTMSGGTLKLGKLSTTLPELTGTYAISGGTIELNGAGAQTLRGGRTYSNLTFSNSGTKDVTSAPTINNTFTIADAVILNVGSSAMGGTGTNMTMTGTSKFITSRSTGQVPSATGTYSFASTTTIEFNGSGQDIRRPGTYSYANIIVSGTDVANTTSGTSIKFQSGGTFTVKNGATFKLANTAGFSGGTTTAIDNTNSPNIVLESGSIIEYNGTGQTVTNGVTYKILKNSSATTSTVNTGGIAIDEELNLNTGTLSDGGNIITLAGNITGIANHASLTAGKILMTGSGKTISGATLGNLELSNAGGFSLSGSPTISGVLTLTNGKLTLGGNDITLNSTASGAITGYDASKYIITNSTGLLKRKVTSSTTYDFPIGSATNYEPATITTGSTFATTTRLDARFISTDPTGPTPTVVYVNGTPIADFLNAGYWSITPDAALSSGSYNITLTSNGHNNADTYLDYHAILKGDNASNTWTAPGTHVDPPGLTMTSSVAPITVSATGISSFSDFAIGKSNGYVLPIVLTNFDATLINTDVWLQWNTSSEVNNDYFEIQRSLDGSIWNTIGQVDGAGSTSVPQAYAFTDANAPGLILYYRLKQVDYNGDFDFSDIRVINNSGNQQYIVHGYYNVAGQFFQTLENAPTGIYLLVSNKGNSKILHTGK